MKKILVTGGAGFIGSNFIKYMLDKYNDYYIVNLDLLTYAGNLDNLKDVENNPNYEFVKGDICDFELVDKIVSQDIDYIINFAAESHVDNSILNPGVFVRTNVMGTQVLLDAAKRYDIEKYIQISTDEVYGSLGDEGYFTEETPLAPNSPYSASKAASDMLVRSYYKTYNLPVNITRCSNNYGPNQHKEKLIPKIIHNALNDQKIPVYGDGLNVRDWLYVEDHCSAIDLVLHKGKVGQVYNIGGNNEVRNIDLVKMILDKLGKNYDLIEFVEDRLGHDRRYAIDSSKTQNDLGWLPKYIFKIGSEETINCYLNNK
ncbi:dTDP-glucose 4,6-dehydratase [Tepidibacter mesophilus]|uniref:dTDP-glucose 4,6-dehydratase n=1 Tax=Tepidibacter mesophilus TaxID=655607 RepID=UPI000C077350|nr:dTDP-glucose 4,6-dehydratase [Tepidibacter mesophilus]